MYSQRKEGVSEPHLAVLVNCKRQLRICREYGIARWPRRSLKSKQNKAQKKFHKSLTDALKEAQKWQNSENKKIEARSSGTHSSENLHDSSLFSSGDNEVAKGNESVHRPGSTNKGERLELNLKNDGIKSFGNLIHHTNHRCSYDFCCTNGY